MCQPGQFIGELLPLSQRRAEASGRCSWQCEPNHRLDLSEKEGGARGHGLSSQSVGPHSGQVRARDRRCGRLVEGSELRAKLFLKGLLFGVC